MSSHIFYGTDSFTFIILSPAIQVHSFDQIVALLPWYLSVCLSGMDVDCDRVVHVSVE